MSSSSSSTYKLSYFNGRGLAECSRYLFALAGVNYEDYRFPDNEERKTFLATKDKLTFGKVPELEVDGKKLPQSRAIERFLAKRFGFMGSNEVETAWIDAFGEELKDCIMPYFPIRADKEKKEEYFKGHFLNHMKLIEKNADSNGYLVGNSITLADLQLYTMLNAVDQDGIKATLEQCPKIAKSFENVGNNDKIKAWIAKRPQTAF